MSKNDDIYGTFENLVDEAGGELAEICRALRHIKIKRTAEAATPAVRRLVAAAIADRKGR